MILGKVVGNIVSTLKHIKYSDYKLLIIQPVGPDNKPKGKTFIAVDTVQAGPEDVVLVIDEGNSARLIVDDKMAPLRSIIVGIVDEIIKEKR